MGVLLRKELLLIQRVEFLNFSDTLCLVLQPPVELHSFPWIGDSLPPPADESPISFFKFYGHNADKIVVMVEILFMAFSILGLAAICIFSLINKNMGK